MTVGRIIRALFSQVFTAVGVLTLVLVLAGEPPFGNPYDIVVWGIFAMLFCAIGVAGGIYSLLSGSTAGRSLSATVAAGVWILFGLCFLSVAILQPEEIAGTVSVNGSKVSEFKGGWSGVVAFSIVGALPILFVRQIYRMYRKAFERAHK